MTELLLTGLWYSVVACFVFFLTVKVTMHLTANLMKYKKRQLEVFGYTWGMSEEEFLAKAKDDLNETTIVEETEKGIIYAIKWQDKDQRKHTNFTFDRKLGFGLRAIRMFPKEMSYTHGAMCLKYGGSSYDYTNKWSKWYMLKEITTMKFGSGGDTQDGAYDSVIYLSSDYNAIYHADFADKAAKAIRHKAQIV